MTRTPSLVSSAMFAAVAVPIAVSSAHAYGGTFHEHAQAAGLVTTEMISVALAGFHSDQLSQISDMTSDNAIMMFETNTVTASTIAMGVLVTAKLLSDVANEDEATLKTATSLRSFSKAPFEADLAVIHALAEISVATAERPVHQRVEFVNRLVENREPEFGFLQSAIVSDPGAKVDLYTQMRHFTDPAIQFRRGGGLGKTAAFDRGLMRVAPGGGSETVFAAGIGDKTRLAAAITDGGGPLAKRQIQVALRGNDDHLTGGQRNKQGGANGVRFNQIAHFGDETGSHGPSSKHDRVAAGGEPGCGGNVTAEVHRRDYGAHQRHEQLDQPFGRLGHLKMARVQRSVDGALISAYVATGFGKRTLRRATAAVARAYHRAVYTIALGFGTSRMVGA